MNAFLLLYAFRGRFAARDGLSTGKLNVEQAGAKKKPFRTTEVPPPAGLGKRFHAWLMAHASGRYERLVVDRKHALLAGLRGDILEIGPGTGPNLQYYNSGVCWTGLEPNPYMYSYLDKAAARSKVAVEVRAGTAEEIPAEDSSVDAVVSTLVLCSVRDPAAVMKEVLRVLRPGGCFVFMEHVAAPRGTKLRRMQDFLCPVWRRLADGCHPNRETWLAIERAGFASVHRDSFRLPLGLVAPQIAGVAMKKTEAVGDADTLH